MLKGAPTINRPRSRYQMNHDLGTTYDAACVVPLTWYEILPGDTLQNYKISYITRLLTPYHAVMDNMYLRCDAFFVPYEVIWQQSKQFFGEVDPGTFQPLNLSIPYFQQSNMGDPQPGSLGDYLGLPIGYMNAWNTQKISTLPLRAYIRTWNYWYRDELTMNTRLFPTDGGSFEDQQASYSVTYSSNPLPAAKMADYFTTCLPYTSKIAPVELNPFSPVTTGAAHNVSGVATAAMTFQDAAAGTVLTGAGSLGTDADGKLIGRSAYSGTPSNPLSPNNLWANNASLTVETLRRAIVYQHVGEILARGGSRYASEFLKNIFGVSNSESLYAEPEYLGGFERPINMTEVLSNADTDVSGNGRVIGDNGAMSKTTGSDFVCDHTFTRHGIMLVLMTTRKPEVYWQGMPKKFTKLSFWDHYLPQAQGLGFQKVSQNELVNGNSSSGVPFGFQDYGAEYRFIPNAYTGYMRPSITGALADWTWSQILGAAPVLNETFMSADKTGINRTLATSQTHQFFGNFHFEGTWTRVVGVQRFPGLTRI